MPIKRDARNQVHSPAFVARRSGFSKVDLKRAVNAAQSVGLEIGVVEVAPDGTISLRTVAAAATPRNGTVFDQWSERI